MPPPPPPPPICFPFTRRNKSRALTYSEKSPTETFDSQRSSINRLERHESFSPTATLTSKAEKLTFSSDSESYDVPPNEAREVRPVLKRANTTKSGSPKKRTYGYGWGIGKKDKDREAELDMPGNGSQESRPPIYQSPRVSDHSKRSTGSPLPTFNPLPPQDTSRSHSKEPSRSNTFKSTTTRSSATRPTLYPSESSSTLIGSALERKVNDIDTIQERPDTLERLDTLRELMKKDTLDYYVVPTDDAHGSEYVAISDKRREWISGFTGTSGVAVISKTSAYLLTDSRYWIQARRELDRNWILVQTGDRDGPADWTTWLADRAKDSRIGIDARMVSHAKATALNTLLYSRNSKLAYPLQNLIDLMWLDKPPRSRTQVFVQPKKFTGMESGAKLANLRDWIKKQAPSVSPFSKSEPKPSQMQDAALITNLACIAWLLNLRGDDIPFNPVFHSYLFVSMDQIILFIDSAKISPEVDEYLQSIEVERKEYNDLWSFLRRKDWGEGKVIITPETSYAISLMLTSYRYTVLPSIVEEWKAVKNEVELDGMKRAYLRDGAAYVRWLAWLEHKVSQGYDITEYEAGWRLTEFRRMNKHYSGLAYENISASGPNAAIPHYSPRKSTAKIIDRDTPFMNDSGGQYRDGTCDTSRTIHFGRPTPEQCEAFTRVLQGHIAIDTAIFPEGTTGAQLDVLARRALWRDGLNYDHGSGHGVGSYLTVHEGPQSFSTNVPLVTGHVITNEPGFYNEGKWGMRIESALFVKRVKTKGEFNGNIWLGFERLTCVPIQTKMVKDVMLSKEERQWLKDHNRRCLEMLEPLLREDKRAMRWLRREAERGIGLAGTGPGGLSIDWD